MGTINVMSRCLISSATQTSREYTLDARINDFLTTRSPCSLQALAAEPLRHISTRSIPYLSGRAIDRSSQNRIRTRPTNTVAQMFAPRYHRVPASTTQPSHERIQRDPATLRGFSRYHVLNGPSLLPAKRLSHTVIILDSSIQPGTQAAAHT